MTDWRTSPIRQVEHHRDKVESEVRTEKPAGADLSVDPPSRPIQQPRRFAGKIRDLFRDAVKALTGRGPAPAPKPRRKRTTGETGGAFFKAARKLFRHTRRPVIQTLGLHEPELWQWNDADCMHADAEAFGPGETNYLSHHL